MAVKEQYEIMRTEKGKKSDLYGIWLENNRTPDLKNKVEFPNSDIDWEKTQYNYFLVECQNWEDKLSDLFDEFEVKTRKNSTLVVDSLYTASAEFFENLSPEEQQEFFRDCLQFHIDEYCQGNPDLVVNAVVHLDESNPHMHLESAPIYKDENDVSHLSAKNVLGGKAAMSKHQDNFYKVVGRKWGLSRGKKLDGENKKKHLSVQDYKIKMNDEKLQQQEEKLAAEQAVHLLLQEDIRRLEKEKEKYKYQSLWTDGVAAMQAKGIDLKQETVNYRNGLKSARQQAIQDYKKMSADDWKAMAADLKAARDANFRKPSKAGGKHL